LEWEQGVWLQCASAHSLEKDANHKGSATYAKWQAVLQDAMVAELKSFWDTIPTSSVMDFKCS